MSAQHGYKIVRKPHIAEDELDALDSGHPVCLEVRPQTLGYQTCWRKDGHDGPHVSQDRAAWYSMAAKR
ncbi:hypothetical protein [Mycobacteroides abscessus]|uniref:hypothetical protein n=1 Tax=Mycobacteroides abscessus TaxID=36809 RepID=UPI0019D08F55|nr:hypothetical protein [Mycobacteroides abscessus]MBN7381678.1 hypothetical protein [Mycobacteroides abscessus subsp. massiliense]